jgi:hypothetical protein
VDKWIVVVDNGPPRPPAIPPNPPVIHRKEIP